jgi:transcriptional regulator with XRE-family HTH domain
MEDEKMNKSLKHAMVDYPEPAYRVAQKMGISHSTISKFIAEIQEPTDIQKKRLSEILGKPIKDLFPTNKTEKGINDE